MKGFARVKMRSAVMVVAAAAVVSLGVAGCGGGNGSGSGNGSASGNSGSGGSTGSGAASSTEATWAHGMCGSMQKLTAVTDLSMPDSSLDGTAAKQAWVSYLGKEGDALTQAASDLNGLPKVSGTDKSQQELTDALTKAQNAVKDAQTKLGGVDASDAVALDSVLLDVTTDASAVSDAGVKYYDVLMDAAASDDEKLNTAVEQDPMCKKLTESKPTSSS